MSRDISDRLVGSRRYTRADLEADRAQDELEREAYGHTEACVHGARYEDRCPRCEQAAERQAPAVRYAPCPTCGRPKVGVDARGEYLLQRRGTGGLYPLCENRRRERPPAPEPRKKAPPKPEVMW